ncbi:MAG: hypothetical protein KAI79_01195 [Bacteroidales bacterium]|nr:hypothetical protein [Bacteroidales bacterium]
MEHDKIDEQIYEMVKNAGWNSLLGDNIASHIIDEIITKIGISVTHSGGGNFIDCHQIGGVYKYPGGTRYDSAHSALKGILKNGWVCDKDLEDDLSEVIRLDKLYNKE